MDRKQSKSKTTKRSKTGSFHTVRGLDRRALLKLLPAVGVTGLAVTNLPLGALAQSTTAPTPSPTPSPSPLPSPQRITKEMLRQTEKLIGIELTDAQEAMALSGVNRNLENYETVRKIDVPLDTEPAIAFHPARANKRLYVQKTKFRFGKVVAPQFKSVDDLAFVTVPELAELIRTRKLSSTELTRMYLARLKRFGPKRFKRARYILVSSVEESFRVRINSASSGTVTKARSSTDLNCGATTLPNRNLVFWTYKRLLARAGWKAIAGSVSKGTSILRTVS